MTGISRNDIESVADRLHAAALGEIDWRDPLASLNTLVPCEFATLEIMDAKSGAYTDFRSSRSLDIDANYLDHYCRLNPRLDGVLNRPELVLMGDYDFLSEKEMERNEFYHDFLRPNGLRYCAGVRTMHTRDLIGTFSLQRTPRHGHVTEDELKTLDYLRRHLRRATLTHLRFGQLAGENELLSSLLARLEDGVMVIGPSGKLQFMNAAAQAVCESADGFECVAGELKAEASSVRTLLHQAAAEAQATKPLDSLPDYQTVVPRRSGLPPYVVTVVPVPWRRERRFDARRGCVIVMIKDPARPGRPPHRILKAAYSLSAAEADVACAIASGLTVRQIADRRGVTIATIRSQLQAVLQKMHLRRQADLVRVVSRLEREIR